MAAARLAAKDAELQQLRRAERQERDAERATSVDLRKALDDALATLEEKRAVIDAAAAGTMQAPGRAGAGR